MGRALSRKICRAPAGAAIVRRGAATPESAALGREHSRTAERDRTRADPLRRPRRDPPRAPVARGLELSQFSLERVPRKFHPCRARLAAAAETRRAARLP